MRLNISAWSIRSPMPAIVTFLVLVILGTVSFMSLPITRFPNIDIPIVQVSITQSGAAPGELETQVTRKVEDAIADADEAGGSTPRIVVVLAYRPGITEAEARALGRRLAALTHD